jgi:hypothetical protein
VLGGDQSGFIQQAVCPRYGVKIHPQIGGELANRGKLVARLQLASDYQLPHLLDDLHVDGLPRTEIKLDVHGAYLSIISPDCMFV